MDSKGSGRFLTLDAMRGLAAIVVMLGHCSRQLDRSGYLAVDFFFLLSGFVIARSYERKLAGGMPFLEFAELRVARLYPMYALGLAIGLAARLSFPAWDPLSGAQLAITAIFNALLLPTPASAAIFPIDPPAWSLFFELLVNFAFAGFLAGATLPTLVAIAVLGAAALIATPPHREGIGALGTSWATFLPGCARTIFSFATGVVISRVHARRPRSSWMSMLPMAVLLGLLFVAVSGPWRALYDRLVVVVACPLLVWFGASFEPPKPLERLGGALGELSFPLYAVHLPIFLWFDYVAVHFHADSTAWRTAWKVAFFIVILPLAWFLGRHVDTPVRKRLGARIRAQRA